MNLKYKIYSKFFNEAFDGIKIIYPDKSEEIIGDGKFTVIINKDISFKSIYDDASYTLAKAYIDSDIEVCGNLKEFLYIAFKNDMSLLNEKFNLKLIKQKHDKKNSEKDIKFHYDIGNEFYKHWLDKSMTYSCAYFKYENDDLYNAQIQKIEHIAKKLRIDDGCDILDIGCGWGEVLEYMSKNYRAKTTGITLSEEQKNFAENRIKNEKLEDLSEVLLMDYRNLKERKFDNIISVGMLEHVGKENLDIFFESVDNLLKDGGHALIHVISGQRSIDKDAGRNGFLNNFIFPGGYIPSVSELVISMGRHNLKLIDMESMRRHYELTLDNWHKNFMDAWDELLPEMGEKFMRMWDLYLSSTSAMFKASKLDVVQYLLEKGIDNNRPLTREYMI